MIHEETGTIYDHVLLHVIYFTFKIVIKAN